MDDYVILNCPHCDMGIQICNNEINCKIYRCGIYKKSYAQIPQHMPQYFCDKLKERDEIFGCSKPFKYNINEENKPELIKCDYI